MFDTSQVWGALADGRLLGFAAAREDWLDHLYVSPRNQSTGVGSALLEAARRGRSELRLWTFQRNALARRFYERRGFKAVRETDGSGNEEREPDVLYEWRALTDLRHDHRLADDFAAREELEGLAPVLEREFSMDAWA